MTLGIHCHWSQYQNKGMIVSLTLMLEAVFIYGIS